MHMDQFHGFLKCARAHTALSWIKLYVLDNKKKVVDFAYFFYFDTSHFLLAVLNIKLNVYVTYRWLSQNGQRYCF